MRLAERSPPTAKLPGRKTPVATNAAVAATCSPQPGRTPARTPTANRPTRLQDQRQAMDMGPPRRALRVSTGTKCPIAAKISGIAPSAKAA